MHLALDAFDGVEPLATGEPVVLSMDAQKDRPRDRIRGDGYDDDDSAAG